MKDELIKKLKNDLAGRERAMVEITAAEAELLIVLLSRKDVSDEELQNELRKWRVTMPLAIYMHFKKGFDKCYKWVLNRNSDDYLPVPNTVDCKHEYNKFTYERIDGATHYCKKCYRELYPAPC